MTKQKFILTNDLVKVEPEPEAYQIPVILSAVAPITRAVEKDVDEAPLTQSATEKNFVNQARVGEGAPLFEETQNSGQSLSQNMSQSHGENIMEHDVPIKDSGKGNNGEQGDFPEIIREQLSLKIDRDIKYDFRIWCIHHHQSMTETLEDALRFYMTHKKTIIKKD